MKKRLLVTSLIFISIGLLVGLSVYYRFLSNSNKATSGPTVAEKKLDSAINAEVKNNNIKDEGNQPADGPQVTASIEVTAKKENNSTVTIISKIRGVLSGSCMLTITNGSKVLSRTAPVYFQSEFSTCAGFSIPQTELGAGMWNISLKVDYLDTSVTKSINFEVNP